MEDLFFEIDDFIMLEDPKIHEGKKLLAFEYGCKIGVPVMENFIGGGANNAAIAFSRMGFKTAFLCCIGIDDRGDRIVENLKDNNISTHLVCRKKNEQTGVSFILVGPGHEHIAFTYRGANGLFKFQKKHKKILNESRWLYVTSLSTSWRKTLDGIFSTKCMIAWNPGREQLSAGAEELAPYLAKTKVLICNHSEAMKLSGISDPKISSESLLNKIKGPEIIIITNGTKGAHAYDGKKIYFSECIKIKKPLNTTGVGDAFGSSFVVGVDIYKGDIQKAMELASKNAAEVVNSHGAQAGLMKFKKIKEKKNTV